MKASPLYQISFSEIRYRPCGVPVSISDFQSGGAGSIPVRASNNFSGVSGL